jgi:hypothetical protein
LRAAAGDDLFRVALFAPAAFLLTVFLAAGFLRAICVRAFFLATVLPAAFLPAPLRLVFAFAAGLLAVLRLAAVFDFTARFVADGFVLRTAATGSISDKRRFQSSAAAS